MVVVLVLLSCSWLFLAERFSTWQERTKLRERELFPSQLVPESFPPTLTLSGVLRLLLLLLLLAQ